LRGCHLSSPDLLERKADGGGATRVTDAEIPMRDRADENVDPNGVSLL
jgi:hypothetical protein